MTGVEQGKKALLDTNDVRADAVLALVCPKGTVHHAYSEASTQQKESGWRGGSWKINWPSQ